MIASITERDSLAAGIGAADEPIPRHHDTMQPAGYLEDRDLVAEGGQAGAQPLGIRPGLDLGRAVPAAEIIHVDRGLDIETPVERGNDRLADMGYDRAAEDRADHHDKTGLPIEDQGWRHRASRPLAGLDAVGDRLAVLLRHEGGIGKLVVAVKAVSKLA